MPRRTLGSITRPLARALLRTVHVEDAWERFEHHVPTNVYGIGAQHEFAWYLEGESQVSCSSIEEIMAWLSGCTYATDADLFHEDDYWQHPCTFEQLRTGDCEDFALWAWRKLIELDLDVEFVAGRCRISPPAEAPPECSQSEGASDAGNWNTGHAWVHFHQGDDSFLFDALPGEGVHMVTPLTSARELYLPEVSVDGALRRYVYGGYYQLQKGSPPDAVSP